MVDFNRVLNRIQAGTVLVVGDIMIDRYLTGDVERISPEAPIPVLRVRGRKNVLGGAANVAGNVRGYHVDTYLSGVLGADLAGEEAEEMLGSLGIHFAGIRSQNRSTTQKTRAVGMNQQIIRIDEEDSSWLSEEEEEALLVCIREVLPKADVVILSDYRKGVCSQGLCKSVIALCVKAEKTVIVDPKSSDWTKYAGASLITPNFREYQEAVGYALENETTAITAAGKDLFIRYGIRHILVTRSQHGMTLLPGEGGHTSFQAIQQEVFDVSGAGDTVIGSIGALLACGESLADSVETANYAAGLSVSKRGTYMVTIEEVMDYIRSSVDMDDTKIIGRERIADLAVAWRRNGERIIFTNGCFDLLHIGHVNYLKKAAALGTKLIVGVNSDESVRRLKGKERPVNSETARMGVLAALGCVDAVVLFTEDTPLELIRDVTPDVLVKGGDYRIEEIVGREYAKETVTIPLTEGVSTTGILARMKGAE